MAEKTFICSTDEIKTGTPLIAVIRNRSIGVFRIGDDFYALLNVCPHRGAPLCEGVQCGTTAPVDSAEFIYHRHNEIIRCAWHGWEFDIRSGRSLVDPAVCAHTYAVAVVDGTIVIAV